MCESIPLPGDSIRDQTWSPICWRSPTSPLKRVTCSLTIPKRVTKTQNFQDLYFLVSPISFRCSKTSQKTSGSSFTAHETINLLQPTSPPLWVFPKIMGFPQIIHGLIGVFHDFHPPFWGKIPYFWKHPCCPPPKKLRLSFRRLQDTYSQACFQFLDLGILSPSLGRSEGGGWVPGPPKNGGWKGKGSQIPLEISGKTPRWRWNIYYNLDRMDW